MKSGDISSDTEELFWKVRTCIILERGHFHKVRAFFNMRTFLDISKKGEKVLEN